MDFIKTSFLSILLLCATLSATQAQQDTLIPVLSRYHTPLIKPFPKWQQFTSGKFYQTTYISIPLIAGGMLLKNESRPFRTLRNDYIPHFHYEYDDYLQYAPAAAMVGMKLGGVKSRHSWGRMLTADAFSVAFMAICVNSVKYTAKVQRPDKSNYKSFPSGHTATAFMTATMLHKEYGLTVSPWISVAGYTVATATGISRQLNNRHWLSDVMVGAGIGILTTELGYLLTDALFKDKGITRPYLQTAIDPYRNPSFLGIYMGLSRLPAISLTDQIRLKSGTGSHAGVEGAWFWNPYVGIGGRLAVATVPVSSTDSRQEIYDPLDTHMGQVGAYVSYPFSLRWQAGAKLLGGYHFTTRSDIIPDRLYTTKRFQPGMGTGLSLSYTAKEHFGVRFFFDYSLSSATFRLEPDPALNFTRPQSLHKLLHLTTWGGAAHILF
ncbi:MAG: phosphatase PAP2 family protein [Coprobacter sp.]|nr:phosphatase PAP2 family protein [Coprobacter sp.]